METTAFTTRERRKRVHSAKCPCCTQGKPELKPSQSRKRKGGEIKSEGGTVLKTKRPSKSVKGKKATTSQSTTDSAIKDEKSTSEGRVLRSGRSTPVCVETSSDKQTPASQKKSKQSKVVKQKDASCSDDSKSSLTDIKPVPEVESSIQDEKNVTGTSSKAKAKPRRQQTKLGNEKSKSFAKSGTAHRRTCVQRKGVEVGKPRGTSTAAKPKTPKNSSKGKVMKKKTILAKMKGSNKASISIGPKKTSAIEKLKVRAFDQLKEKLEIAFDRSSISVPECVQLLQQITSPNLSEIFDGQPASMDEGSSGSLIADLAGKSLPQIMTEGMHRSENSTHMKEKAVAENLSKAAQTLAGFRIQVPSTASGNSRMDFQQGSPSSDDLSNSSTQIPQVKSNLSSDTSSVAGFPVPDQLYLKNTMGNVLAGVMTIPGQAKMGNNFSKTAAFGRINPAEGILQSSTARSNDGMQSTSNQELQKSNLPVSGVVVNGNPLVKTSVTESSTACFSTNPLIPTTNQFLPTTNPLNPTTNQLLSTTSPLISTTNTLITSLPNISTLAAGTLNTDTPLVAISPGLPVVQAPNGLMTQPQMAFQLLQVPSQGTTSTLPTVMTSTQTQQSPRLICPNTVTLPRTTTPSVNQQPSALLTGALNQRLLLPQITPPLNQKTLGSNLPTILSGIKQPHDLLLSKTAFKTTPHAPETVITTSTTEIPSSCKLRPILPREPMVSQTFALFNPSQQTLQNANVAGKASDISSNVKQAVKRLVNGRTRNTESPSPQQTKSLPDIASTFNKAMFTANSPRKVGAFLAPVQSTQEYSEMANKEQAIKALLSIGSGQQMLHGAKGTSNITGSKVTETKNTGDLAVVVFDTDKGIFKVDDVTIDPQVNTIGKESYTCGKCGKIFTSLSYLARHIKRVCPDMTHRKWKCDHCEKAFRHPFGLQQHVFTHTGERPHKCSQCPKAFYSSNDLRRHSRIHSGERPYKCKHCEKTFATTISLKTHTFIHTGEKPHRCPHCPKTFATSSKLGRHIVTHSEQRPFACTQCPKTFNRSGDLRRHSQNLHEAKLPVSVQNVEEKDMKKILDVPKGLISNITEQKTNIETQAYQSPLKSV